MDLESRWPSHRHRAEISKWVRIDGITLPQGQYFSVLAAHGYCLKGF